MAAQELKNGMSIFLVEDDAWYNKFLTHYLTLNPDNVVESFSTGQELIKNLYKNPTVVVMDYSLPDLDGLKLLEKVRDYNPDIFVIVVSGQEDIATAVNLLKFGAVDYIVKNDETKDRLWAALKNVTEKIQNERRNP